MSTKDKRKQRFKTLPKDFTWNELVSIFVECGYTIENKGKTSGSRVRFRKGNDIYLAHRPHPSNVVKEGALKEALNYLTTAGLMD